MPEQQLPPHDRDAEQALLGACLIDEGFTQNIMAAVQVDDFYQETHQKIYSAICESAADTGGSDLINVSNVLRSRGELESCGGGQYLTACINELPSGLRWKEYARRVREYARRREIIFWASDIAKDARDTKSDFSELLSGMATDTLDFNHDAGEQYEAHRPVQAIEDHWEAIEEALNAEFSITPARWGIPGLDSRTGGIGNHQTVLVMAKEKTGKTKFATHAALSSAAQFQSMSPQQHVLYCPLEEGRKPWVRNAIAWAGEIDAMWLLPGRCPRGRQEEIRDKAAQGLSTVMGMPLLIHDRVRTADELVARIEVEHKQNTLGLVVVDYLQRLGRGGDDERTTLMEATGMLSDCADRIGAPIVICSQMSVSQTTGQLLAYGGRGANFDASLILKLERDKDEDDNKKLTGNICCVGARHIPEFADIRYRISYERGGRYYDIDEWHQIQHDEQQQKRSKRLNPSGR